MTCGLMFGFYFGPIVLPEHLDPLNLVITPGLPCCLIWVLWGWALAGEALALPAVVLCLAFLSPRSRWTPVLLHIMISPDTRSGM